MIEILKKPVISRLCKVILFMVIMVAGLAATFDFYYDLNDDTTIKDIISGAYTGSPSGYNIQMLYPLSYVVSLFYRAIPGIPWYGLFLCICQFGAAALIAWRAIGLVEKLWMQIGALIFEAVLFLGLLIKQLVIVQYSVTSGICMATAIFLFTTGEEKESPKQYVRQNIAPILLVILAFMIRTEMCLMLFPFLLLVGFGKWMTQEKIFTVNNVKRYLYVVGAALLGMMIALSLDKLAYATATEKDDWKSYQRFFDARTKLYDFYGLPDYEKNQEYYKEIGLSRESYTLLENYNFSLDESIDEHVLEELVQFHKIHAGTEEGLENTAGFLSKNSLKEAIWLYKNRLLNMESDVYAYVLLTAYVTYAIIAGGRKKSGCYWKIALLLVIRSILWIYLFMVGRCVERVTCPLLVAEINVLLAWVIEESTNAKPSNRTYASIKIQAFVIYFMLGICSIFALTTNIQSARTEYENRERVNSRWEALITYCKEHEDSYYVVDVYSSTSYEGIPYSEEIFEDVDNSYRNFDICGGWLSKSPLMYEKLARMQISDLESALYSGEQAYFIAAPDKDLTWLVDYYAYKGKTVKPEKIDTIYDGDTECFLVYQLQ